MENTKRCVFALNGVTGMLIATVLLLSILAGLTCWGIKAQQGVMQAPYTFEKPNEVKMGAKFWGGSAASSKRSEHIIIKGGANE